MSTLIGFGIGVAIAAAIYIWKSGDRPAKAVRSIFARGYSSRDDAH